MHAEKTNKVSSDPGNIKPKTIEELQKKPFYNTKENIYRVNKLMKLMEILQKPDFDIELDEMKFSKVKKYKDYPLVKLTHEELKKLLSNYDLKEETYINFLGINKIDNDSYSLQLDVFTDKFIRINLKDITFEENCDAIFKMYDKKNEGKISKKDFYDLMMYFSQISLLAFDNSTMDIISNSVFSAIDKSKKGHITKQDLKTFLEKYKDKDLSINPFTKVKAVDAVTKIRDRASTVISPEDEIELERIARKRDRSKINKFWFLNKKMIIFTIIYFCLCFTSGMVNLSLEKGRQYANTKAARFFAGIIFLNFSFILLFMCTTTITFLSSTKLKFFLPLGDTVYYHEVCGCVLGVSAVIHAIIHIAGDFREIAAICATKAAKKYVTVAWLLFSNVTGLTGFLAFITFMMVIIPPLIPYIRNNKYEVFWYIHKLFYVGIGLLVAHANTPDTARWPVLFYLILPSVLWVIELIFRIVRYCMNKTKIKRLKYLQSGVIVLELEKPKNFNYLCGQYASINIPVLAKWEWHPFTFASSPEDDNVYFYIAPAGDWCRDLKKLDPKEAAKAEAKEKSDDKRNKLY